MKVCLSVYLALAASLLAESGLPDRPYLYVRGEPEIEKPAEIVTLRFDLVARQADQAKANQEVQAKAGRIFALLAERKIAESDLIAAELKSEPEFEADVHGSGKRGKQLGYSVRRGFRVKVREVAIFPKLIDDLLAIPGLEFTKIDSGLADEKQMKDELRARAMANAREEAQKTLGAIGMQIESIYAISPVSFHWISAQVLASRAGEATSERVLIAPAPSSYRLAPVTLIQTVHVLYLIALSK